MTLVDRLAAIELWDRLNPLVVRTVRQGLRSRTFVSVYLLLLCGCSAVALFFMLPELQPQDEPGRLLLTVLASIWSVALLLVQPLTAFRALNQEREADSWDLLAASSLTPAQILRGMLGGALVQNMLLGAAVAPFAVIAYLMRGVELTHLFAVLVLVPLAGVSATVTALLCACVGPPRRHRGAVQSLLALLLIGSFSSMVSMVGTLHSPWGPLSLLRTSGAPLLGGLVVALVGWLYLQWLQLEVAAALLERPSADHSTRPRLAWAVGPALVAAGLGLAGATAPTFDAAGAAAGLATFLAGWTALLGLFAITEDGPPTPAQLLATVRAHRGLRPFMALLGPGPARGRLLFVSATGLALALAGLAYLFDDNVVTSNAAKGTVSVASYAAIYLLLADALGRGPLRRLPGGANLRRTLVLVLAGLATLIAMAFGLSDVDAAEGVALLSPLIGPVRLIENEAAPVGAIATFGAFALVVLATQGLRGLRAEARRLEGIERRHAAELRRAA